MEHDERVKVIAAMKLHGGGFVRALAAAWQLADDENSAKIERAWPQYIARYRAMAEESERT